MNIQGTLHKMKATCPTEGGLVTYSMVLNGKPVLEMNNLIGKTISFGHDGKHNCVHCDAKIKKTFGQGSCYPCFTKLACNDLCIMKPETCHFAAGSCREPEWAQKNCMAEQSLYLARSGSIKIGITRGGNHLIRWADQGASEAMLIGTFPNRLEVGKAEKAISKGGIGDRTSRHKMLKNEITDASFDEALEKVKEFLNPAQQSCLIDNPTALTLEYPHQAWPTKVKSMRLDKVPTFSGVLTAIKGQYLVFEDTVLNMRSHAGYQFSFTVND